MRWRKAAVQSGEDASEPSSAAGQRDALARARDHLFRLQHEHGWWHAELETNVTTDAEYLLFRESLGIRDAERTAAAAAGSAAASARTGPGPTIMAAPATCRPRSRRTWRCGSPATRPGRPT